MKPLMGVKSLISIAFVFKDWSPGCGGSSSVLRLQRQNATAPAERSVKSCHGSWRLWHRVQLAVGVVVKPQMHRLLLPSRGLGVFRQVELVQAKHHHHTGAAKRAPFSIGLVSSVCSFRARPRAGVAETCWIGDLATGAPRNVVKPSTPSIPRI